MALQTVGINWLAVIVATVVSFVLGWIWYGPLFGKAWLKGSGMNEKEAKKMHKEGMGGKMVWNIIGTLVTAYVLANVIGWAGISGIGNAIWLAVWLGVGFLGATTLLGDILWKGRPWSFFWINLFYWVINFALMGSILVSM
jgi:hypothetical protein